MENLPDPDLYPYQPPANLRWMTAQASSEINSKARSRTVEEMMEQHHRLKQMRILELAGKLKRLPPKPV